MGVGQAGPERARYGRLAGQDGLGGRNERAGAAGLNELYWLLINNFASVALGNMLLELSLRLELDVTPGARGFPELLLFAHGVQGRLCQ